MTLSNGMSGCFGILRPFTPGILRGPHSVTSRHFAPSRVEWAGAERLGTRLWERKTPNLGQQFACDRLWFPFRSFTLWDPYYQVTTPVQGTICIRDNWKIQTWQNKTFSKLRRKTEKNTYTVLLSTEAIFKKKEEKIIESVVSEANENGNTNPTIFVHRAISAI